MHLDIRSASVVAKTLFRLTFAAPQLLTNKDKKKPHSQQKKKKITNLANFKQQWKYRARLS
jgi:hypothetical protein